LDLRKAWPLLVFRPAVAVLRPKARRRIGTTGLGCVQGDSPVDWPRCRHSAPSAPRTFLGDRRRAGLAVVAPGLVRPGKRKGRTKRHRTHGTGHHRHGSVRGLENLASFERCSVVSRVAMDTAEERPRGLVGLVASSCKVTTGPSQTVARWCSGIHRRSRRACVVSPYLLLEPGCQLDKP
jgi:hypothetical protein